MHVIGRALQWLAGLVRPREPAEVAEHRAAWRAIAAQHGFTFERGPHLKYVDGDRIRGQVDGREAVMHIAFAEDFQKGMIALSVTCRADAGANDLWRDDLVAWYDARRGLAGLPPIDDELVRWILGRCSLGEGYLTPGRMVYQQRGCIEPDTVALMLAKLPTLAQQLEQAARASGGPDPSSEATRTR
jgi:hypothetical protein